MRKQVRIDDVIGWDTTAKSFADRLEALGDFDELDVLINSPGGAAYDGVSIYNQLKRHKARVHVVVDGLAASAASLIAMAGDTITMAAGSMLMLHRAWGIVIGNANDMLEAAALLEKLDGSYGSIYASRPKVTLDQAREWQDETTWFTAQEAVDAGLADNIEGEADEADVAAKAALAKALVAGELPEEIRAKVRAKLEAVGLAAQVSNGPGGNPSGPHIDDEEGDMDIKSLTFETLAKERPDLIEAASAEAKKTAKAEGAKEAKERAKAISELAGKYEMPELAAALIDSDKDLRTCELELREARLEARERDASASNGVAPVAVGDPDAGKDPETKAGEDLLAAGKRLKESRKK